MDRKPREIAFEGIDGAGKTTVINTIMDKLTADGTVVVTSAPFREASELLGHDIYEYWSDPCRAVGALSALRSVVLGARQRANVAGADVLLWDRHWMTLWQEIEHDNALKLAWRGDFVPAALLRVGPEVAARRIGVTDEVWTTPEALRKYASTFERLAFQHPNHVYGIYRSSDDVSPEAIAASVIWDMGARR